jgi:hypothetical protein
MINNELGIMKLKHIFKKAVYIGPKVYGGITSEISPNLTNCQKKKHWELILADKIRKKIWHK